MNTQEKNKKLLKVLAMVAVGMFGFGFLLVPIYNTMCKAFGINGKTALEVAKATKPAMVDKSRWVTVEFLAMNANGVPWKFKPSAKKVMIHPGEMKRISYYAENYSDKPMIVQAIPSVTPGLAAKYFKKTECFCFTQQTLQGHEAMNMPLLFHLDPELPDNIKTVTLSYTVFDVTERIMRQQHKTTALKEES